MTNFGAEENSLYRNVEGALFEDAGAASGAARHRPAVRALGDALRRLRQRRLARPLRRGRPSRAADRPRCSATIARGGAAYVDAGDRAFAQKTVALAQPRGRPVRRVGGHGRPRRSSACRRAGPPWPTSTATARSTSSSSTSTGRCASSATRFPQADWIAVEPRPRADGSGTVLETRVGVTAGGRTQCADVPRFAVLRLGLARAASLRARAGDGRRRRGALARRRASGVRRRRRGPCVRSPAGRNAREYDRRGREAAAMIPIGDDNSDRRITPVVTWLLIGDQRLRVRGPPGVRLQRALHDGLRDGAGRDPDRPRHRGADPDPRRLRAHGRRARAAGRRRFPST